MDFALFARGFGLGFAIAAVVGPIALLCLRRALISGFALSFASGLGAATADAAYAAMASFGFSALASLLVDERLWLRLVGGTFLLYLGGRTLIASPAGRTAEMSKLSVRFAGAYTSTLALTLSNPMTILSFVAIFAGIGASGLDLVAGVFGGSAAWWLVLAGTASRLRSSFNARRLRAVNIASGALIAAFGVHSLGSALLQT